MKSRIPTSVYLLFLAAITLSFLSGFVAHNYIRTGFESFPILLEAHQLLKNNAYYEIPSEPALEYGMIRGMLTAYGDEYTRFVEPVQHELDDDQLSGEYGGIGVRFGTDQDGNVVMFPFPDSPAVTAGIQDGDNLLVVDELQIGPQMGLDEVSAAVRGPEGTQVTITVRHIDSGEISEYQIERQNIPLPSVTWHPDVTHPEIGVIEINLITATTAEETQRAIEDLLSRQVEYLLIDLRNNRGGLVDTGVNFASMFLENGLILEQSFKNEPMTTYSVRNGTKYLDIPLAVLINQNTASAAEIIGGVLQARNRAVLIGSNSYGKNTIQYVFTLSDESSIHITSSEWTIPDLVYDLADKGLVPDIVVEEGTSDPDIIELVYSHFILR